MNSVKAKDYLVLVPSALTLAADAEIMLAHHVTDDELMTSQRDAYETLSEHETVIHESARHEVVQNGAFIYAFLYYLCYLYLFYGFVLYLRFFANMYMYM